MNEYFGLEAESFVTLLYRLLLRREPDQDGLQFHADSLLKNRITCEDLARNFVTCDEFTLRTSAGHGEVRLRFRDCEFVLPAGAAVIGELISPEGYEPWVLPYFLDHCRPGMTVLDIGASWGVFALPAARRVGESGKVYAVEVSPSNCHVLHKSLKASGITNVQILPLGVSDHLGSALLRKQETTNNNSLSPETDADLDDIRHYDIVPTLPIDLLQSALGPVQIVKMDIEGMEYRASIGALSFLREQRPLIFTEYSPRFQQYGSGVDGGELLGLFLDLGYRVEILHRHAAREALELADKSDVINKVDAEWRRHVELDHGTHLDLCLHPELRRQ